MKLFGPLSRAIVLIGVLIGASAVASPAFAGPAEMKLLQNYLGTWKGRGQLVGAESETVTCRLSITDANEEKINYSGRCSLAGQQLSVAGTMAYIDDKRRYEAAMTSNVTFNGVAIGKKQGDGVVFDLKEQAKGDDGSDMTITSRIELVGGKINVEFSVLFNETGDSIRAQVPFTQ